MTNSIEAKPLTYGDTEGEILVLTEPISFWGGIDPETGIIADIHHPEHGQCVTNRILALHSSRGSSTGSYILMELMRAKIAPKAILLSQPDGVICTGVLVGGAIYGYELPVIQIPKDALESLKSGVTGKVVSNVDGATLNLK